MAGYHQHRDIDLSVREREVLELMAKGRTNGEIAQRLDIAFDTAKSHVSAIISKLGVETREEAVRAWKDRQRLGARASRMVRGLVGGIGVWKVAAGAGAIVVATGAVYAFPAGGSAVTSVPATGTIADPATGDEFHVLSIDVQGRELALYVQRQGDEQVRVAIRDESRRIAATYSVWVDCEDGSRNSINATPLDVVFGCLSTDGYRVAADSGGQPVWVDPVTPPAAAGLDIAFWMIDASGDPAPAVIQVVDAGGEVTHTYALDADEARWQRRPPGIAPAIPTPTP